MGDKIFTVPDEVETLVSSLERAWRDVEKLNRQREEAIREKYRRINRLRYEREDEIKENAEFVFEWVWAFAQSDVGQRIIQLDGHRTTIPIFIAKFWLGEPEPKSTTTVCAKLQLHSSTNTRHNIALRYVECHKGRMASHIDISIPSELWQGVHPDFLAQCAEYLKSDNAFGCVIQELKRCQPLKP